MPQTDFDSDLLSALIDQVDSAVSTSGGLANVADWIVKNTAHPTTNGKPWSFDGHAYQKSIVNDCSPQVVVRKSTQTGMSELIVRLTLALLAKIPNVKILYVLPSAKFASKFVSSRIDPVIEASPRLKSITDRNVNSTEIKKIGSSFLFMAGAANASQAISVPGRGLVIDEYDFCDPSVLSVFTSRLGHQKESERIIRQFSSPLFPKTGISALFESGTQNVFMCWHETCGQWVVVDSLEHIILPGFDQHLSELTYAELESLSENIPKAFVKCQHCGNPISVENLADPVKRAWVPTYPGREISSYEVDPLCLPTIRTPQRILSDLSMYKNTPRWVQYAIGRPAESASDQILEAAIDRCFQVSPSMASAMSYGTLGCDIGKISHITVGRKLEGVLNIGHMSTVLQTEENTTSQRILDLQAKYLCQQSVIDAMPDLTIPKAVQGRSPLGMVWACYFVSGRGKSNLEIFERKEDDGVVSVARTRAFDEFVGDFNKGRIRLPMGLPFEDEIRAHLSKMKRILNYDAAGDEKALWVTTDSSNHWFFSLFYCWIAARMVEDGMAWAIPAGLSGFVKKVKMKTAA